MSSGSRKRDLQPENFTPFQQKLEGGVKFAGWSILFQIPSITQRLEWKSVFETKRPVEVELGSGDGSFILQWAEGNPDTNFLAVERLLGRIQKIDRKGRRLGLQNLRGIRLEASYLLEWLLPPKSIEALHIYFPDPWPKRKHRRHRLVNERFPALAASVLLPGGKVYLRTDDLDYFGQMLEVFQAAPQFASVETPAMLASVTTDFERHFNAHGIATQRATFQLI